MIQGKTLAQKIKATRFDFQHLTDEDVEDTIISWQKNEIVVCKLCGEIVPKWLLRNHDFHNHYHY